MGERVLGHTPNGKIDTLPTRLSDRVWFMSRRTVPSELLEPAVQTVGYARVGTTDENLDRQTDRLTSVGASQILTDTITGST